MHPPTGKWLIAAGIKIFGFTSFGQRFMAALFGVLLVLLVYLLAGKLFHNRWISIVSGFLVATDFLLIVESRTAMLDIFLAFFVVLGFLFVSMDRERVLAIRKHLDEESPGSAPGEAMAQSAAGRCLVGPCAFGQVVGDLRACARRHLLCLSWSTGSVEAAPPTSNELSAGGELQRSDDERWSPPGWLSA